MKNKILNIYYALMGRLIAFLGNFAGAVMHTLFGCKKFYKTHRSKRGKAYKRVCQRCGKRWDRLNGSWQFKGQYKKRI